MAMYKDGRLLTQVTDEVFDKVLSPGELTPLSGIYRCTGCGREIVSEDAKILPPQNHHQHSQVQGAIRWWLIVFADHRAK
jgi:hypothetical protein